MTGILPHTIEPNTEMDAIEVQENFDAVSNTLETLNEKVESIATSDISQIKSLKNDLENQLNSTKNALEESVSKTRTELINGKRPYPNWNSVVSLAIGADHKITKIGWVLMRNTAYTSALNGYINGRNIFTQYGQYGKWQEWNSFSIMVDVGDTVRLDGGGELLFIPCKGGL